MDSQNNDEESGKLFITKQLRDMKEKKYLVDGKEYSLVSYEDLTVDEEAQINALLGFQSPDDNTISLNVSPDKILPLLLVGDKENTNFKKVSYKTLLDIMTDFIVARVDFFYGIPNYLQDSIELKMKQKRNFLQKKKAN